MAKRPKKAIPVQPLEVESTMEGPFNYIMTSRADDQRREARIDQATDPIERARLVSKEVKMFTENAHTVLHIGWQAKLLKDGILTDPVRQLKTLQGVRADIDKAIAAIESIDWPETPK